MAISFHYSIYFPAHEDDWLIFLEATETNEDRVCCGLIEFVERIESCTVGRCSTNAEERREMWRARRSRRGKR